MAELLYRYQQILTILRDKPAGMTNKEILEAAKTMRGNELPNDALQMAVNTQALRRRGFLDTHTIPETNQKLHIITQAGKQALEDAGVSCQQNQCTNTELPTKTYPISAIADILEHENITEQKDFDRHIDNLFAELRKLITGNIDTIKISDKHRKITLLELLENINLFDANTCALIAGIRADIEQMDPEL
jgi:hypothetical protein